MCARTHTHRVLILVSTVVHRDPQILEQFPFAKFCRFLRMHMLAAVHDAPTLLSLFAIANRIINVLATAVRAFPGSDYRQLVKRCVGIGHWAEGKPGTGRA